MNFARVINDIAVDVSADPANSFHPTLVSAFEAVPDEVQVGWVRTAGVWAAPTQVVPPAPAVVYPTVSPIEFKLLFTAPERIAIYAAKASNPVVADILSLVDDQRLTGVNLNLQSTLDTLNYLASVGLIAPTRVAEIRSGVFL